MITGLIVFHVILCIFLCLLVLLQFGKGAEAGAMMGTGGASQNIFTTSNRGNFFTKLTALMSFGFVVTSLALSLMMSKSKTGSVLDGDAPVAPVLNRDADTTETKSMLDKAKDAAAGASEAVTNTVEKSVDAVKDSANSATEAVSSGAESVTNTVKDAANTAKEAVTTGAEKASDAVKDAAGSAKEAVTPQQ